MALKRASCKNPETPDFPPPHQTTSDRVDVECRAKHPEDTVGCEGKNPEHQMAERLEVAADAEIVAAELILDASIGAFSGGALVVCQVAEPWDFDEPAP